MIIYIENLTQGDVSDPELLKVIAAIQVQIDQHFGPAWNCTALLKQKAPTDTVQKAVDVIVYLYKQLDVQGALGYHDKNNKGVAYGVVATELSKQAGEAWSVTLSHEILELLMDPEANRLAMGPHPTRRRIIMHWYEMCDAVQGQ